MAWSDRSAGADSLARAWHPSHRNSGRLRSGLKRPKLISSFVEEGNLHVHVSALRESLDEHGEGHSLIVTVPGRGYRLADLTGLRSAQMAEGYLPPRLPLPDKPSIAVLPFQKMSGDPE